MLPIFAAFDSTNYLIWCSLYLEDMQQLPTTAPEVYSAFMEGRFAIKRTNGNFKAVGADLALEQTINRAQKSASGIIGSSRKKNFVTKWELTYHEMFAITNLHRELAGVGGSSYELEVNRAFSKARTTFEESNIQSILNVIEKNENPFEMPPTEKRLHNILTKEVMPDDVRDQILNVDKIAAKAYKKLRTERFIDKSVRLSDTIHRTNSKTFASVHSEKGAQNGKGKATMKKEDAQMKRTLQIAQERGKTMDELLQYDVCTKSPLFDDDGFMIKAVKSDIVHELERYLSSDDPTNPQTEDAIHTCYIVDVMANIRKLQTKNLMNFKEFADAFIGFVVSSTKGAARIDLIFDSYMEKSLKDSERQRRTRRTPIELHAVLGETPIPREMDRFWPSSVNKFKLESLIHKEALGKQWTPPSVEIIVSHFSLPADSIFIPCWSKTTETTVQVPELIINVEEADLKCLPHAKHAARKGNKRTIVLSSDTDVFVLFVYHWRELNREGLEELWIKTGVGHSTRFIPIHILARKMGATLCEVLPAIHTLTGCDFTSKVGTKHAALMADPESYLRDFNVLINGFDNVVDKAEAYLTQVLKKRTNLETMNQLRSYKYHHSKQASLETLPPTSHAVRMHIRRAFYATHEMVSLPQSQVALDPREFGFKLEEELLVPVRGSNPIPEDLAVSCTCKKCGTKRCSCRNSGNPCCAFCDCQSDIGSGNFECQNSFGMRR